MGNVNIIIVLCSNTDDDDNGNDDGINGKIFSLDDVFNDTFNPKLFSADWISGMSVCQFVCHYLYTCT